MPEKPRSRKHSSEESSSSEVEVRFKPFLGISPRSYVPAVYAVVILVGLFFLLLYPGIRNNGSQVRFTSSPPGASVLVDGVRIGATPVTAFVEQGMREVEIRKPYFAAHLDEVEVGGRIFGSLIIPRRQAISATLTLEDGRGLLEDASRRFSRWALVGRASAQYQFPLVASSAIEALTTVDSEIPQSVLRAFVLSAAANTRSDLQLRDVSRATSLAEQNGTALGSRQLVGAIRTVAATTEDRPAVPLWLAGAASDVPGFEAYRSSTYFQNRLESYTTELITESLRSDSAASEISRSFLTVDGIEFARVPTGRIVLGGMEASATGIDPFAVPVPRDIDQFYMMRTEVTVGMYRRFVSARPQFRPGAREELSAAGLADEAYLAPFGRRDYLSEAGSAEPVRSVSFHAAVAFADWLSESLPPELADYEVRLPAEQEWEWAAVVNAEDPRDAWMYSESRSGPRPASEGVDGRLGISDLLGNVWEWCNDWYRPAAYPFKQPGEDGRLAFPTTMRVVRGGSWANPKDEVTIRSRGSQEPVWSTPYLGFRVVLVQKNVN